MTYRKFLASAVAGISLSLSLQLPAQAYAANDLSATVQPSTATVREQRIELRQKLLASWLLTTLDEALKKSMLYKGHRPAGSEYIQGLLQKYQDK